jgi:hypothetical protein
MRATGLCAGLGEALVPLCTETVTFLESAETGDSYGEGIDTWTSIAGLTDLAAAVGPVRLGLGYVNHGPMVVSETEDVKVVLPTYHPEIQLETHRMRWNGIDWRITANYPAAVHAVTELRCERVLPSEESPDV